MSQVHRPPPSLRKRYLILTAAISLLVITVVSFSYRELLSTKNSVTNAYEGILTEKTHLEVIRNRLLAINKDINLFLLDPINEDLTRKIDRNTEQSLLSLRNLNLSTHDFHWPLDHEVTALVAKFTALNAKIKLLIDYRRDVNKQYPGMSISANVMEIQQDAIKSGFEIMIDEIESGDLELNHPHAYPLLLKSYAVWISAISQTRIYMTNRLASFSTEILREQGNSLYDIYQIFRNQIQELTQLYAEEDSFEGPTILSSISNIAEEWYRDFMRLREISESDRWRSDTVIVKSQILPLSAISRMPLSG